MDRLDVGDMIGVVDVTVCSSGCCGGRVCSRQPEPLSRAGFGQRIMAGEVSFAGNIDNTVRVCVPYLVSKTTTKAGSFLPNSRIAPRSVPAW